MGVTQVRRATSSLTTNQTLGWAFSHSLDPKEPVAVFEPSDSSTQLADVPVSRTTIRRPQAAVVREAMLPA
jgi:hypothetical protein